MQTKVSVKALAWQRNKLRVLAVMTLMALSFLLWVASSGLARADWTQKEDDDGIKVFVQEVAGSDYNEFKGVMTVRASVASVLAVLDDTPSGTQWIHNCVESKLLKHISFLERYTYQVSDLPWPVDDRDIVVHSVITQDPKTNAVTISLEAAPDFDFKKTDNVRVQKSKGFYLLEPLPEGYTRVTWRMHTDPAGSIPTSLVNALLVDMPYNTLKNLQDMLKKDKYQSAEFKTDENGTPIDWAVKKW